MNLSMKQKQTHRHREQTCDCQMAGAGDGCIGSLGLSFDTEWMNNKVLLYSTENYSQYLMINHKGEEYF